MFHMKSVLVFSEFFFHYHKYKNLLWYRSNSLYPFQFSHQTETQVRQIKKVLHHYYIKTYINLKCKVIDRGSISKKNIFNFEFIEHIMFDESTNKLSVKQIQFFHKLSKLKKYWICCLTFLSYLNFWFFTVYLNYLS